jgi:acyl carrier protein
MMDKDGYLFIKGRIKEIINRGGEKISPREIDEALLDHPDINEATAFAVPHATLGEDIAAAVVISQGVQIREQEIREFCFQCLADFKVPSQIIIVPSIPKGATGKLQRIGLAAKLTDQLKKEYVAPRNEMEEVVATVYSKILDISRISIFDNFFALGGDSLKGTQVISRLRMLLGIELPIPTLFRKPTVAELAAEISRMKGDNEYVAPRNKMEEEVATLITTILNISRISIFDNFFALGGESLKGSQVISCLRTLFNVDIPIATLFRNPTVAELAAEISQMKGDKDLSLISSIMTELDELSEEEARQLLARELGRNLSDKE